MAIVGRVAALSFNKVSGKNNSVRSQYYVTVTVCSSRLNEFLTIYLFIYFYYFYFRFCSRRHLVERSMKERRKNTRNYGKPKYGRERSWELR